MTDEFLGIKAKLERAQEQFHDLIARIQTYDASKPYELPRHVNTETGKFWYEFRLKTPVPIEWSVIVGEMVHNLRSALDHLVWQMIVRDTGSNPSHLSQFPIFHARSDYKARGEKYIRGVSTKGAAIIESLQPFSTGHGQADPLWHLCEISNWDKHRRIHLAQVMTQSITIGAGPAPTAVDGVFAPGIGPIEDGAIIGGGTFVLPERGSIDDAFLSQVKVQLTFTADIGFQGPPGLKGQLLRTALRDVGSTAIAAVNRIYEEIFE